MVLLGLCRRTTTTTKTTASAAAARTRTSPQTQKGGVFAVVPAHRSSTSTTLLQQQRLLLCCCRGAALASSITNNTRSSSNIWKDTPSSSSLCKRTRKKFQHHHHHDDILHRCFSTSSSSSVSGDNVDNDGYVHISIEEARTTTALALEKIGWDNEDAKLQADIMTHAELCGNNQGLVKMYQPALMAPSSNVQEKPIVERETSTSAVINGKQAPGMLAAVMAADLAISKVQPPQPQDDDGMDAPPPSISIVCTYNTSTSSGQLGYYVERMAESGCIGLACANSPEFVSPAAGAKAVFGTNPLAVSMPQDNGLPPYTFDMATSAIALFGVLSAKAKNEPLPSNVAYDSNGDWTTDASKVLDGGGSIATFGNGDHKGMGLSLCVELLAGALSGAAVPGMVESKKVAKSWGHLFIAIRPECFVTNYTERVSSILKTVETSTSSSSASGDDDNNKNNTTTTVRIPGQRSQSIAQERKKTGIMPIPIKIWESIVHTSKHGLSTSS